jgi:hypothetical protein
MAKTLALLFWCRLSVDRYPRIRPGLGPNEMPLNIFHVNAAHNVVHLLTGVVALLAGMTGIGAAKTFFKIFGVV